MKSARAWEILVILTLGFASPLVLAAPAAQSSFDFEKITKDSVHGGHYFGNRGTVGGSFRCLDRNSCAAVRKTGDINYLDFSPLTNTNGARAKSCYMTDSSAAFGASAAMSISAYIYVDSLPTPENPIQTIVGRWSEAGAQREWRFGIRNDGTTTRYFFEKTADGKLTSKTFYDSTVSINSKHLRHWHHVAFVRRGPNDVAFYVNGRVDAAIFSRETNGTIAGRKAAAHLGCDLDSNGALSSNFTGRLENVAVYNQALTVADVSSVLAGPMQRYLGAPNFSFLGSLAANYTKSGSLHDYDIDETLARYAQLDLNHNDSIDIGTGIRKTTDYQAVYGRGYAEPANDLSTLNSPTMQFLKGMNSRNPASLPMVRIDGNLGRPDVDGGDLGGGLYGDGTRKATTQKGYEKMVRDEGFRMVEQLGNFKKIAPQSFNRYVEDDFLAPRKKLTILDRTNFLIPACTTMNKNKVKMSAVIYCGSGATDKGHLEKYASKGIIPASLAASYDHTVGARTLLSLMSYNLTAVQKTVLSDCIDEVIVYDQKTTNYIVDGKTVTSFGTWDDSTVGEMDSCVSYLRANSKLKVRVGMYMGNYGTLSAANRQTNITQARRVAADGYDFFGSLMPNNDDHFDEHYNIGNDEGQKLSFPVFNWLRTGLLDADRAANKEQRTRFINW